MSKKYLLLFVPLVIILANISAVHADNCTDNFGAQGYSCMDSSGGTNCKTGYCAGGANIQCCQAGLGILPKTDGSGSVHSTDCKNPQTGAYDANYCGDYGVSDFVALAINVARWILGIVGTLTLVMFIYGGVMFMISAGSAESVDKAKKIITAAVVGLLIVFSSYLIIQFVLKSIGINWNGTTATPTAINK